MISPRLDLTECIFSLQHVWCSHNVLHFFSPFQTGKLKLFILLWVALSQPGGNSCLNAVFLSSGVPLHMDSSCLGTEGLLLWCHFPALGLGEHFLPCLACFFPACVAWPPEFADLIFLSTETQIGMAGNNAVDVCYLFQVQLSDKSKECYFANYPSIQASTGMRSQKNHTVHFRDLANKHNFITLVCFRV